MTAPLSNERLAEIREHQQWYPHIHISELLAEVDRLRERLAVVEKFCAARAEFITAINNCHPDNSHDYWRWQGHAEGRRQLSQELGLPVAWPPEYAKEAGR